MGEVVRKTREKRAMTQEEVATIAGLTKMTVSYVESGKRNTKIENLRKIAAALEIDFNVEFEEAPTERVANVIARFTRIAPKVDAEELDAFVHDLAIWEKRFGGRQ